MADKKAMELSDIKTNTGIKRLGVLGGGAWGTALGNLAAQNGADTLVWMRDHETAGSINNEHENTRFLPGIPLSPALRATDQLGDLGGIDALLIAIPAQALRGVLTDFLRETSLSALPVACASKGIERGSLMLMPDVISDVCPQAHPAMISGPSFAHDVAKGLPTAVTLAAPDADRRAAWLACLGASAFRLYPSADLVGAALGGAVKNVLAIAAGIVEGRGLGESARAAVIARGFAEFQRLALAMGGRHETLTGLSGLGDLVLTASSQRSRNMAFGLALGQGTSVEALVARRNVTSEGAKTAQAVVALAAKHETEMPICAGIETILDGRRTVDSVINELLNRPVKSNG